MINAENTLPVFSSTYYINTAHLYMGYFCPAQSCTRVQILWPTRPRKIWTWPDPTR